MSLFCLGFAISFVLALFLPQQMLIFDFLTPCLGFPSQLESATAQWVAITIYKYAMEVWKGLERVLGMDGWVEGWMYLGSDVLGTSVAHISATTARIATFFCALKSSPPDLSNAPSYVSPRRVVVARQHDLCRHGHGHISPYLLTPYLAHFPTVFHVLGVYGTASSPFHQPHHSRSTETPASSSSLPCW